MHHRAILVLTQPAGWHLVPPSVVSQTVLEKGPNIALQARWLATFGSHLVPSDEPTRSWITLPPARRLVGRRLDLELLGWRALHPLPRRRASRWIGRPSSVCTSLRSLLPRRFLEDGLGDGLDVNRQSHLMSASRRHVLGHGVLERWRPQQPRKIPHGAQLPRPPLTCPTATAGTGTEGQDPRHEPFIH